MLIVQRLNSISIQIYRIPLICIFETAQIVQQFVKEYIYNNSCICSEDNFQAQKGEEEK